MVTATPEVPFWVGVKNGVCPLVPPELVDRLRVTAPPVDTVPDEDPDTYAQPVSWPAAMPV